MTIQELSRYYFISKNLEKRKKRLKELKDSIISSSSISEIKVSKTSTNNDIVSRIGSNIAELTKLIEKEHERLLKEEIRINEFLSKVSDEEIKYIIISRFLEFKTWDEIADEMYLSRTSPYYKLKNYLRRYAKNG